MMNRTRFGMPGMSSKKRAHENKQLERHQKASHQGRLLTLIELMLIPGVTGKRAHHQ
jgi:hypothetical protein